MKSFSFCGIVILFFCSVIDDCLSREFANPLINCYTYSHNASREAGRESRWFDDVSPNTFCLGLTKGEGLLSSINKKPWSWYASHNRGLRLRDFRKVEWNAKACLKNRECLLERIKWETFTRKNCIYRMDCDVWLMATYDSSEQSIRWRFGVKSTFQELGGDSYRSNILLSLSTLEDPYSPPVNTLILDILRGSDNSMEAFLERRPLRQPFGSSKEHFLEPLTLQYKFFSWRNFRARNITRKRGNHSSLHSYEVTDVITPVMIESRLRDSRTTSSFIHFLSAPICISFHTHEEGTNRRPVYRGISCNKAIWLFGERSVKHRLKELFSHFKGKGNLRPKFKLPPLQKSFISRWFDQCPMSNVCVFLLLITIVTPIFLIYYIVFKYFILDLKRKVQSTLSTMLESPIVLSSRSRFSSGESSMSRTADSLDPMSNPYDYRPLIDF